jgi:peptidylprolyl isomerase
MTTASKLSLAMSRPRKPMKRLILALLLLAPVAHAGDDPVVAQRGGDRITLSQARTILASLDADSRRKLAAAPALTEFLRNVLLQRAVLAEAQAQHWEQRPEVAAMLQRTHDLAVAQNFLLAQAAVPTDYPPDADIAAAYEQNKARFMQARGYHLAQIVLSGPQAAQDATRRKLADLRAKIGRAPTGMEEAAKRLQGAQYADIGWLAETQMVAAVQAAVSRLPVGGLSDPVCINGVCHLFRLVETRAAGPAPLADVRNDIARALRQQKEQAGERAYANTLLLRQPVQVDEIQLGHLTSAGPRQ